MANEMENIKRVYDAANHHERHFGFEYYDWQRGILANIANKNDLPVSGVVAAFCALTPNNSEKNTYIALMTCIAIVKGKITFNRCTSAFPRNQRKAIMLLCGDPVHKFLSGLKVVSFYHNTMNPDSNKYVTVDGHMINLIKNEKIRLTFTRKLGPKIYQEYSNHIRAAAKEFGIPAPRLQSILWMTWKRLNKILWTPQHEFDFMHPSEAMQWNILNGKI